ncbi:MAG TPA: putative metal-binding motif-containing protein [Myxococcota bacterium]|nr:putative metal-binding motif-containing protein [Myxococcota bacterium]
MRIRLLNAIVLFLALFILHGCSDDGGTKCTDVDGDGYGAGEDCLGTDCNDGDANVNPDSSEIPYDGLDNDCDSSTPDDDLDGDGYLKAVDCDDEKDSVNPGADEKCTDGVDNDCDGKTDANDDACEACSDNSDCDDGLFCTLDDACLSGDCQGTANRCDDGNTCTKDSCSEEYKRCENVFQPQAEAEGVSQPGTCDNNQDDDCDGLTDSDDPNCNNCAEDMECTDGNDCTMDTCSGGDCNNTPLADGVACDDGQYCTVGETCLGGTCPLGVPRDCDDAVLCTIDACNEQTDRCDNTWVPRPGEEGLDITDTCENGMDDDCDDLVDSEDTNCWDCTQDSQCDDGNICTEDACDGNRCVNAPVAGTPPCDDGLYCTIEEICVDGVCQTGKDRDCDDSEICTADACDEDVNECSNEWQERPGEEGLEINGSCTNNQDDDCDGLTDMDDVDDCDSPWTITPGTGIGPILASQDRTNFFSLGQVRAELGEQGTTVDSAAYTLAFLGQTMSATGIDSNASPNQQFDDEDHIISVVAGGGLNARTIEGLGVGSTLGEVHAVGRFASPDRSGIVPAYGEYPGGKMEYYFGQGFFVGYNNLDQASLMTVTRSYPHPPDGTIDPAAGRLTFGGTSIECGDGYTTGSFRDVHQGILGAPDWDYGFSMDIDTQYGVQTVDFYLDSYRILGIELIGGDDTVFIYDVDRLVIISLYLPYYGRTSAGHGLGTSKGDWETELGAPTDTFTDQNTGVTTYLYTTGARKFAVTYTNNGSSQSDLAVLLVLNYQTP